MACPLPAPVNIILADSPYLLRPLDLSDLERLRDFFYSHTPETIHLRYGYMIKDMTPERAFQLVGMDQTRDMALGIFEDTAAGQILHAVGRYCLDESGTSAEAAFVVRESKRGLGMADLLLQHLLATAKSRNLEKIWASVAPENHPMLHVLRNAGFKKENISAEGALVLQLQLKGKPRPGQSQAKKKKR